MCELKAVRIRQPGCKPGPYGEQFKSVNSHHVMGYRQNEHTCILVVHHKDKNRENNTIENLEVLCPNCHAIRHIVDEKVNYVEG